MVKKLFKHEILAYFRVWWPLQVLMIFVAAVNRLLQEFAFDDAIYDIVFGSSSFAFAVCIIASLALVEIFSITRFYKNLFTCEGYLSFTLPITPTQHVIVKLLTAFMFQILTVISILISVCVITSGDVLVEIIKSADYLLGLAYKEYGLHIALYAVEFIIAAAVSMLGTTLLFYACISIGQTFKKNRIAGAVITYFAYYWITQIITTVFTVMLSQYPDLFETLSEFASNNPIVTVHIAVCSATVISAVLALMYFFVTKYMIKNKLNLE